MGVSKIVREIEGIVGDEWEWERGIWVKGLDWVVWEVRIFGVFLENEWEWVVKCDGSELGVDDDWFVGNI